MDDNSVACFCHQNGGRKIHNHFVLETMLPVEYNYLICTYNECVNQSITCRLHLNCSTKDEALEWLEKCSSITKLSFIIEKRDDAIFARCSCMKNDNPCKTALEINLNSNTSTNKSSLNEHQRTLQEHPATVNFHYTHDFSEVSDMFIEEVDVDGLYDWNDDERDPYPYGPVPRPKPKPTMLNRFVQDKLYDLFDKDYSPEQVYEQCRFEIHNAFVKYNTHETLFPNTKWVYERFYDYLDHKHGANARKELLQIRKRWAKSPFNALWKKPKPAKKISTTDNASGSTKEPIATNSVPPIDPLHSKIDELCKKYVPILPATEKRDILPEPETTAPSASPQKLINSVKTATDKNTPSYVIKFNSEPNPDKLNLSPLNDSVVQNKLPELRMVQNSKGNHVLKMMGVDNSAPQNISIACGINGIIILANCDQQPLPKQSTSDSNLDKTPKESPPAPVSLPPRKRKHPRKACLKYEDADEIFFTDKVEELIGFVGPQSITKKSRRKSTPISRKTRKAVREELLKNVKPKSVSKKPKPKRKSARISKKNKKVVKCRAVAGIENIICSD